MRKRAPLLLLALSLAACLQIPPRPDASLRDAGRDTGPPPPTPPRVLALDALDQRGTEHPLEAIPTSPVLTVTLSEAPWEDPDEPLPIWLFRGDDLDELRDDLGTSPLRASTEGRVVAVTLASTGASLTLTPEARLTRGETLAIGVGSWLRAGTSGLRMGEPWLASLRVSDDAEAGASVTDSWPPDGASAVPLALGELVVRFDGPIEGVRDGLALLQEDGAEVPGLARAAACDAYGWADGSCAVLEVDRALAPSAAHRLVVSDAVLDATGAPVGPWVARFTTAATDEDEPPSLLALPCGLDEQAIDGGCLLADDSRLVLRVQASEPVRLALSIAGRTVLAVAPRGSATLAALDLPPDTELAAILRMEDLAGHVVETTLALRTAPPLPTISIVEVRADPLGTEPRQEYVEVLNYGATSVDLEGMSVTDRLDSEGDVVPRPQRVAPGQRALLVADDFDPEDPADPPVPPGVPLVRIGRSIATGGITNAGEALFLRDASMQRLSSAPALPTGPGACIVRVGGDPRGDSPALFTVAPCTPGLAPSAP